MSVDIAFGGLAGQTDPVRVPVDRAITASDCYIDDNVIKGRNGYRLVQTGGAIGSGTIQGFARWRPTGAVARTVVVRGGKIYLVTDPTTSTASDGAVTALNGGSAILSTTANCSLAQLGSYLYIAPDDGSLWVRLEYNTGGTFAYSTVTPLAKPSGTGTTTSPTYFTYDAESGSPNCTLTVANCTLDSAFLSTTGWHHYYSVADSGYATVTVNLNTSIDMSSIGWLFFAVCPMTANSNGGYTTQVEIGNTANSYAVVGTTTCRDHTNSANGVYFNIVGVSSDIKSDVKHIRFKDLHVGGNKELAFHGHFAVPVRSGESTQNYYVSYYNSTLLQESALSDKIQIVVTPITPPTYHNIYASYQTFYDGGGNSSTSPDGGNIFNNRSESKIASPTVSDIVPVCTISGTSGVAYGTSAGQADKIRLYRAMSNGTRLVKTITNPGNGSAFTITDDIGDAALSHQTYVPQGTPPACEALATVGGRAVAGGGNINAVAGASTATPQRLNISSFVPFTQGGDPFPQFPQVPTLQSDGWAFDTAPTTAEQILWLGNGDNTLYILSNEACHYMGNLSAPIYDPSTNTPIKIWQRGAIGRNSAIWAEDRLFWCGTDGIYTASNRATVEEMSKEIRNLYTSILSPTSSTIMGYQDRNLYVFCGTKFLRYNFVNGTWTSGTVAHTFVNCAFWRDPTGTTINMWFLDSVGNIYRWQSTATSDAGTSIPDWVYSTGFVVNERNTRPRFMFVDTNGTTTVSVMDTTSATPTRSRSFTTSGESELAFPPDLKGRKWRVSITAVNTVTCNRVMYEQEKVEMRGG